jgi:L-ascorbate metabolism protein UlaG (beta-lactamase superfamily)
MAQRAALTDGLQITWLGHSTFKLRSPGGKTILIDPWVAGNPACPAEQKQIDQLDLMLCTHGHFDHIGDAVEIAKRTRPRVVGIFELCHWLASKGVDGAGNLAMNKGGTQVVDGISITMVHAVHSCGITDGDQIVYGGEAAGYVIQFENGFRLYHAGDTAVFGDMRIIREIYQPDAVMLPIGDQFVMSPREAAYACRLLEARTVIPMHFGTFPILTGTPDKLRQATAGLAGLEIIDLQPGETLG